MSKKVKQCTLALGAVLSLISVNLFAHPSNKTIIVASESTTPGWMSLNEQGKLEGYDHDVWQEINVLVIKLNTKPVIGTDYGLC